VKDALAKAAVLVEALPYIKNFYGKTVIIKYGGHAMLDNNLKNAVLTDIVLMKYVGMNPVVVHGGGPEITGMLTRLGVNSQFMAGLRVTDKETMEIVEMVLVGKINREIVSLVNKIGGRAIGLSGKDDCFLQARKKMINNGFPDGEIDLGYVGEINHVKSGLVFNLINQGYIPVIAPVAVGSEGESYNVNADHAAGEIASALAAEKLVILTDVAGVLADLNDEDTLISTIKVSEIPALMEKNVINKGMIPKIECCIAALGGGVKTAHILDGRTPHAILLEIFTDQGVGTMVVP